MITKLGSLVDRSGSPRRIRPVADWKPELLFLRLRSVTSVLNPFPVACRCDTRR